MKLSNQGFPYHAGAMLSVVYAIFPIQEAFFFCHKPFKTIKTNVIRKKATNLSLARCRSDHPDPGVTEAFEKKPLKGQISLKFNEILARNSIIEFSDSQGCCVPHCLAYLS